MIPWISVVFVVISPFAFLILLIWVFSFLILVKFAKGVTILFIFSMNQLLFCSFFVFFFFCFYFINLSPYFYCFSPSACFGI
jgi:hypothetical protein